MAKNIHPKMNNVLFKFSQGREMSIPSSHTKPNFLTETDIFIHAAWREDQKAVHAGSIKVAKFNQAFGGASFAGSFSGVKLTDTNTDKQ